MCIVLLLYEFTIDTDGFRYLDGVRAFLVVPSVEATSTNFSSRNRTFEMEVP
jgi:hypothetical protein